MNLFLQQLQQAWYSLQKRPGLLINMVSTIGLTLGALICALTLIYFMNFKPLAYANHQNLYHLTLDWFDDVKQLQSQGLTHEQSEYLFKNRTEQLGVALSYNITDIITSLEEQPSVETNYVTDNWFDLLSAELVLGSLPQSDSSLTDHSPTALISYELWQSYFSGDINVLDQTITIRGVNHRIVGVMSKYFQDPEIFDIGREVDVWLNWNHNWSKQMGWNDWQNVEEAIRVLALSSPENVANQLAMLNVQLGDAWQAQVENNGSYNQWSVQLEATSLQTAIYGDQNMLVYMVALACLGVFIICIANTTNLLLSRTIEKHYHLSIQAALGAKPRHIRQLVFAEIFLIMMLTLPVSLLVSSLGFDVIRHNLTSLLPRTNEMSLNGFNVLVSVLLLLLVSIIFTYFCARIINYRELRSALASSGKGVGAQVSQRTRNNLIVSQVTIASLLIFANSILFLRAYQEVTSPPTLAMDDRWQLRLTAKNPAELNRETLREALFEMKLAFEQHPSIAKVSQSLSPLIWSGTFPFTMVDTNQSLAPQSKFIDENYFSVLAQPMLHGDNFTREQIRDRANVVVVNEVLAKQIATDGDVVGMQMNFWGRNHSIIGVVKGTKKPNEQDVSPMRYTPDRGERPIYIVQFKPNKAMNKQALLRFINEESRYFTLFSYRPIKEDHDRLLFAQYTTLTLAAVLTLLTVFLAGIGLYGVLNYSCLMRRREFGTRLSLGAKRIDIIALALRDNCMPVLVGIAFSVLIVIGFSMWGTYIVVNFLAAEVVLAALITTATCLLIGVVSSYLPLRSSINKPVVYSLKGE